MRDELTKIFKQCFKSHVGIDDFGCDDCNQYVERTLALFQKLVESKRVKRGTNCDFIINGMVDDLLEEMK